MSTSWKPIKVEELQLSVNAERIELIPSTDKHGGKIIYTAGNTSVELDLGMLDGRSAITITTKIDGNVLKVEKLRHSKTADISEKLKEALGAVGCFRTS